MGFYEFLSKWTTQWKEKFSLITRSTSIYLESLYDISLQIMKYLKLNFDTWMWNKQ